MVDWLKGVAWMTLCLVVLVLPALAAIAVYLMVLLVTRPFSKYPGHRCREFFIDLWIHWMLALTHFSHPSTRLRISTADEATADAIRNRPLNTIVMANHQLYLDWIYLWSFLSHLRLSGTVKFVLKRELLQIPIFGLGMRLLDFVVVSRNWEEDKKQFDVSVKKASASPFTMTIFPEGTVVCEKTLALMHEYARSKGLSVDGLPRHSLLPKVTGMYTCANCLDGVLAGILDVTIGYEGVSMDKQDPESTFGFKKLFCAGLATREVHILVKYYRARDVPFHDRALFTDWLNARFREKEKVITEFTKVGHFPKTEYHDHLMLLPPHWPSKVIMLSLLSSTFYYLAWKFFSL